MAAVKNDRKINALLQQMQQQTGLDDYKKKKEAEERKNNEFSSYVKDLAQLEMQDPLRVTPQANINDREERVKEDQRHRERRRIMARVNVRQNTRGQRTYS